MSSSITHEPWVEDRIDVGSGDRPYEDGRGWVHFDIRDTGEYQGRAEDLHLHFREGSAKEIRATHILEHFPYADTVDVLRSWHTVLEKDGRLYLEVPNLSWQTTAHWENQVEDEELVRLMYGEQDHSGNFHYAAFTEKLLKHRMIEAGFMQVLTRDIGMVICAEGFRR